MSSRQAAREFGDAEADHRGVPAVENRGHGAAGRLAQAQVAREALDGVHRHGGRAQTSAEGAYRFADQGGGAGARAAPGASLPAGAIN